MDELVRAVRERLGDGRPAIVGLAGPVAAGKTTVARALTQGLGGGCDVLGTDAFLLPNATLGQRGIEARKGFPESFDSAAIEACLQRIRGGVMPVEVPVYSHAVYDIVPGERRTVDADIVVVEGVNALQPPAVDMLDVAIYVDADETDSRRWFTDRLLGLVDAARDDEASFYRGFVGMDEPALRSFADSVWDAINGPNLREHIAPSRSRAHIVVTKGPDHEILEVTVR